MIRGENDRTVVDTKQGKGNVTLGPRPAVLSAALRSCTARGGRSFHGWLLAVGKAGAGDVNLTSITFVGIFRNLVYGPKIECRSKM